MDEEKEKYKIIKKGLLKSFFKKIIVIVIIFIVLILLSGSMYTLKRDKFKNVSDTSQTYSGSVNAQGQTVIIKKQEDGTEKPATVDDMVDELQPILDPYMGDDDEKNRQIIEAIIDSEMITKQPYRDSVPEGEINGQIKFYRYTDAEDEVNADDIKEEKRLKYMPLADFRAAIQAYNNNTVPSQDIFKYFTLDESQKLLIACGEKKHRKILTGVDGTDKDYDLSLDIINGQTTANTTYSGTHGAGFEATEYTIVEKAIDYIPLIEQYIMPSNLLYALLIQTEDEDFVKAIADLAYGNEIAIGIYDNKTFSESIDTYTYKKLMKIDIKTNLNYKDTLVSITDSSPTITLKSSDLVNSPYEYIPISCETQTIESDKPEENGKINHLYVYKKEGDSSKTLHDDKMFINETNYNNEITELGEGDIYKTTYTVTTEATSTPTTGILLADTWVAKWEETYAKKVNNNSGAPSQETDLENKEITTYADNNSLYSAFSSNNRTSMQSKISAHAFELRTEAIRKIIADTLESTYEVTPENVTFSDTERKTVLSEHLGECSECQGWVTADGLTVDAIDTIFTNITSSSTANMVNIKNHYDVKWTEYAEEKEAQAEQNVANKTNQRKQEFARQLNVAGTISASKTLSGSKQYVNTKFSTTSSSKYSEYQKSGKIERTEEGVKFSNIFNAEEFHAAKQMLLETEEWFWEYIRENEDTAKLEDILKYLFNKSSDSTDNGTFTEDEVDEIFGIFEPTKQMETVTSSSGMDLLKQYIRMFENSYIFNYVYGKSDNYTELVSQYITQDRTAYYVKSDGHDHPTVGFGVDLFNGGCYDEGLGKEVTFAEYLIEYYGYTETQLKDMSGNTTIPVEIVDELEEKEIKEKLDDMLEMSNKEGINLKNYQVYALVSFNFNTGKMYKWGSYNNFIEMYKQSWKDETDDKYGEEESSVDYTHKLYTDFFYKSRFTNQNGEKVEVPGLIDRRKSEWTLFQTGYMNNIDKWVKNQGDYPNQIRTFKVNGYIFPEYPQKSKVGDTSLYANERFGYPEANKTLGSSGCGVFSMSMILSGLLGDATIDPITYRDAMEKDSRIGYSYHAWDPVKQDSNGSDWQVLCNKDFLNETYGVRVEKTNPNYDVAIEAVKQGKCVLACEPGHYVSVIQVPDEFQGQGYEFFILDSARGHTGPYKSIEDFIQKTGKEFLNLLAIISY